MKSVGLFFVLLFSASASSISLEDYAKEAQFLDIKISPSGKYYAATSRAEDGNIQLIVLNRATLQKESQQHFKGSDSIEDFYWANDERLILTLAREIGPLQPPVSTGELFAMNADGKRRAIIAGLRAYSSRWESNYIIDWLPEDDKSVLTVSYSWDTDSPFADVYRLNIYTGQRTLVVRTPLRSAPDYSVKVITDGTGHPRFAVGMDPKNSKQFVSVFRPTPESEWIELTRHHVDEGSFIPLRYLEKKKQIVGISNNTTDTDVLSLLNLETKTQETLARHPKTDISPIYSIKNGNAGEIIGASYEYDAVESVLFEDVEDRHFSKSIEMLMPAFAGRSVQINSSTRDNQFMVVSVSSANAPPEYYLFDTVANKITYLVHSKAWLKPAELPQTRAIVYKSRDGVDIQALLTLPKGVSAENLPLIMLPHGGPHEVRDSLRTVDTDAKVLAEHGYAVLQPNFRGSGGLGTSYRVAGYKNWGKIMIDDMTDGVQHLIKNKTVDPDRICAYGGSYGGYAALMSAIREPQLYKCTVGFVGVYDLNLMYKEGDVPSSDTGLAYLEKILGKDPADLAAQSPINNLDKLKAPVLLIHGAADKRVPIIQAQRLREELDKRKHPYQWLVKENEAHGFQKPENNVERWQVMLAFFDKYIGKKAD